MLAKSRDWPGNVRELESFIERALISSTGPVLDYIESETDIESGNGESEFASADLRTAERSHILSILTRTNWKISGRDGAASQLNVPESTLRSMMKRLDIQRPQ